MPGQDFFTYCTSLKPLDRRELGKLSTVRHFSAGQSIYRAGQPADALFIINRGMVEMLAEASTSAAAGTYLSRGDIFGDLEMLSDLPRKHEVRTCEGVSVQMFHRRDLPELQRRVPSFFRYLSEQLASRLLQARDLALARSHCLELSGSLNNFDLVTIFQTITNSMQTGELSILDEAGGVLGAFAFENGQVRRGQFQHLTGEEAFRQLFLATALAGTFSFATHGSSITHSIQGETMTQPLGEMLINALRERDEFEALRAEFPDPLALLLRAGRELHLPGLPAEQQALAAQIWQQTAASVPSLHRLYSLLAVSELKIYQTVKTLLAAGHLRLSAGGLAQKVA